MNAKICPKNDCRNVVRIKEATEMPTLVADNNKTKTVFDVTYCDNGHVLGYNDRTVEISEDAPIRQ